MDKKENETYWFLGTKARMWAFEEGERMLYNNLKVQLQDLVAEEERSWRLFG